MGTATEKALNQNLQLVGDLSFLLTYTGELASEQGLHMSVTFNFLPASHKQSQPGSQLEIQSPRQLASRPEGGRLSWTEVSGCSSPRNGDCLQY